MFDLVAKSAIQWDNSFIIYFDVFQLILNIHNIFKTDYVLYDTWLRQMRPTINSKQILLMKCIWIILNLK